MKVSVTYRLLFAAVLASVAVGAVTAQDGAPGSTAGQDTQEGFRFRSGIELINVTATITDQQGRFISGLRQQDFMVYEDGEPQTVSHFSADRVPVSLGIALDTSGSMTSDKMASARSAIDRLTADLSDPADEM